MVPHDPLLELEFVKQSTIFSFCLFFTFRAVQYKNIFVLQIDKIVQYLRFICFRVVVSNVEFYK